jgi:hypothetical protein
MASLNLGELLRQLNPLTGNCCGSGRLTGNTQIIGDIPVSQSATLLANRDARTKINSSKCMI